MSERKVDEWGEWERLSRHGWQLVPGTETPLFHASRAASPPAPDRTGDLRERARSARTVDELRAVVMQMLGES